jgi:cellulase
MRVTLAALVTLATVAHEVLAHGYVPQLKIGNNYIAGWDLAHDPYTTPRVRGCSFTVSQ